MSDPAALSSNTSDGQVAADLRAAANVLERDGWTQRTSHDSQGSHCVAGALEVSTGYEHDVDLAARFSKAIAAFGVAIGKSANPLDVYRWNDAQERTAAQVIAALRAAADRAEAQS